MTSSATYQLATPPSSIEIQDITKHEEKQLSEKADLNNYVNSISTLIGSLWQDPALTDTNTLSSPIPAILNTLGFQTYIIEILKRSRTPLHILQITIFYMFKLQKKIKNRFVDSSIHLKCPKKVFLMCLILAFKYSMDSNYKFCLWSKISGLSIKTLQNYELKLLIDLNYQLNDVNKPGVFNTWAQFLDGQVHHVQDITARKKRDYPEPASNETFKRIKIN